MTWLKLLLALAELTLNLSKVLRERGLVRDAEIREAQATMELTNAKLRAAMAARTAPTPADPGVRDPYRRD